MSQIPSSIGRYDVMNPIGQGGMGSLYLAWDPKLERKIAIKLLRDDDESLRERFSREARAAARLRHPNIVTIFDVGDHEGQPFIAMEYIQGHTLAEMIHRKMAMPLTGKLELMEELCDGLGFAHKAGIVHRDIKPANLMVDTEGQLKILDFGIARASESAGMTQAGMLIGTLNYMSPEQVSGATVDARSDIFAVGSVFYELISYKQAFPGGLLAGILNKILTAQFEPIGAVVPGIDPEVARIMGKALERDPARRYQELQSMRKELLFLRMRLETQPAPDEAAAGGDTPTVIVPTPTPVRRTSDREDLLRRRAAQIDAHLNDAEQKLGAGDFDGALASCEHALVIDADHARANELLDRVRTAHDEAIRRQQEAQERAAHEARARQAVEAADRAFAAGRHDEAIAGLADFTPPHELASRALERLRGEAARIAAERRAEAERIAAERRAEAERRARQERIAAGLQSARALVAQNEFADAIASLRALEGTEGVTPEVTAALRDAEARQREAERLARIAREAGAHVEAAADLLARKELQQALMRADAALALDAQHPAARDLRAKIDAAIREELERRRAEEAARRAEEAAARQREKASAAAIKQARKAKTAEAAVAVLRDALRTDPNNAELQLLLEARQADHARVVAEQQEKERLAAAALAERQRQAAELAEKQRRAAAEAEQQRQAQAEAERQRRAQAEAERQRQAAADAERRKAAAEAEKQRQAEAEKQRLAAAREKERQAAEEAERDRKRKAQEAAASSADDRTVVLKPGMGSPMVSPSPASALPAPAKATAAPAAETRKAPVPVTSTIAALADDRRTLIIGAAAAVLVLVLIGYFAFGGPDAPPAQAEQTAGTGQSAPPSAPAQPPTVSQGATTQQPPPATPDVAPPPPASPQTQSLPPAVTDTPAKVDPIEQQLEAARRDARRQLQGGDRTSALATAEAGLRLRGDDRDLGAVVRQLQTDARAAAVAARTAADVFGTHATSLQTFRDAQSRFADAERHAAQRRMPDSARAFWLAEELFNRAAQEGRAAKDAADREAAAAKAAAAAAPPVTAPVTKPEPPPTPPPAAVNPDETAIRGLMQRYADAYTRSDAAAVVSIQPSLQLNALRRSFGGLSSQRLQLANLRVTLDSPTQARVEASLVHEVAPRAGAPNTIKGTAVFRLEKVNGAWIIRDRSLQ